MRCLQQPCFHTAPAVGSHAPHCFELVACNLSIEMVSAASKLFSQALSVFIIVCINIFLA